MSKVVFLHVGSPKTGTTFLQHVLWSQREVARQQGLLLPMESFFDHYLASLDVRDLAEQEHHPERAVGIWQQFVEQSRAWEGNVLVSHELFAGASEEQAARAIAAFGDDAEVHVVVTARDLVRQIPAEWQEHVKHRSEETFEDFVGRIRVDTSESNWFWQVQDFADVARRWGGSLPPSHVHVVTVPSAHADPDVLWQRFATLVGLDPASFDLSRSRTNTSLRLEQAELLRRLNGRLGDRLPIPGPYPAEVKDLLAHTLLAGREGTRFALEGEARAFALEKSRDIAAALEDMRLDVVGDLRELYAEIDTEAPQGESMRGGDVASDVLLEESLEALAAVLDKHRERRVERDEARGALGRAEEELSRLRPALEVCQRELERVSAERDELVHEMHHRPFHHLVIGLSERWRLVMKVRVGYWRAVNAGRAVARVLRRAGRDKP